MRWRYSGVRVAVLAVGFALAMPAAAFASSAVVLVSGFDTATPFTVPLAACAAQAGPTWGAATGPAASLRASGEPVFTAPVANAGGSPGPPCTASGGAVPPAADVLDSNGEVDANGAALMHFLQFLSSNYGVTSVSLVGHSDGGLWSRSAITQLRAAEVGPTVQSLTTLGTPHTGSFGADLAELVVDGRCDATDPTEQLVCQALLSVVQGLATDLGPTTLRELTSSFMEGWNPQQTIGCPVSVAAGTFVNVPYIGSLLPRYYNPSDGIVGQASALGEASTSLDGQTIPGSGIPQILQSGSFPVVHTGSLSFLGTDNTLTNDAAVGAAVVKAVQAGVTSSPCSTPGLGVAASRPLPLTVRVSRPFNAFGEPDRHGRVARLWSGEVAFLLRGASIRCRGHVLASVPLLGSRRVRVAEVRCPDALRVRGRVLLLGRDPRRRTLVVTRRARILTVRVHGPALRQLRVSVRVHGRWRRLQRSRVQLPTGRVVVSVRASGIDRGGGRRVATAVIGP
ncbi:MAG: alpha/beta hydrolase [Solirubrobacteraceae bacterium]